MRSFFFILRCCFLLFSFFLFDLAFAAGGKIWSRTEMVEMAGYGEQKLSSVIITGSLLCDTSSPHHFHSIAIPGVLSTSLYSCVPMAFCLHTWWSSSQVLQLPSSVTLDSKGDQDGLRLLLMIWESLKSIFLPNSTQLKTLKTHVSSSQYMCLSSMDAITTREIIHTNASNFFPLPTASVSTKQGRSGYSATVRSHSKLRHFQQKIYKKQQILEVPSSKNRML